MLEKKLSASVERCSLNFDHFLPAVLQVAADLQLPLGIEWSKDLPTARPVTRSWQHTSALQILKDLVQDQPECELDVSHGVVHIALAALHGSASDMLNMPIESFDVRNEFVEVASRRLQAYVRSKSTVRDPAAAGLGQGSSIGLAQGDRRVTFSLQNVTVRDVLDELCLAADLKTWVIAYPAKPTMTPLGFLRTAALHTNSTVEDRLQPSGVSQAGARGSSFSGEFSRSPSSSPGGEPGGVESNRGGAADVSSPLHPALPLPHTHSATCDSTLDYDNSGGQITLFGDSYTSLDYSHLPFGYDDLEAGVNVELDGPYGPFKEAGGQDADYVDVEITGTAWTFDVRYAIYGDHYFKLNDINYDLGPTGYSVYVPSGGGGPVCSRAVIDSVYSSDDWIAGNSVSFTISGSCFGNSPTLAAQGYVPNNFSFRPDPSTPDTTISGSLTIDPNATTVSFWITSGCGGSAFLPNCTGGEGSNEYDVPVKAPICAVPTKFRQNFPGFYDSEGILHFKYLWDSSTGNLNDLSNCTVGERVDFSPSDLPLASPPFPPNTSPSTGNPTIIDVPAQSGGMSDENGFPISGPSDFVKPYQWRAVVNQQVFRYKCPCMQNDAYQNLVSTLSELMAVTQESDGSGNWVYTNAKPNIAPANGVIAATVFVLTLGH